MIPNGIFFKMKKSAVTKEIIIKKSSELFNTKGFKNTSISDITEACGFTKGAIYRHFENKEALELEALNFMVREILFKMDRIIKEKENVFEKFEALFDFFLAYVTEPIIEGGCPLLNTSIEVDDTESVLKLKTKNMLTTIKVSVRKLLENGVKYKQLDESIEIEQIVVIIIASLEGGIMMSKLTDDKSDLSQVITFLKNYLIKYKLN